MSPDAAAQRQIERYLAMTGEERLKITLDLHEFACNVALAGIRRQFPEATADEVEGDILRLANPAEPAMRSESEFLVDILHKLHWNRLTPSDPSESQPMQSEPTNRSKGFLERARLRCSWMRSSKPISLSPL